MDADYKLIQLIRDVYYGSELAKSELKFLGYTDEQIEDFVQIYEEDGVSFNIK